MSLKLTSQPDLSGYLLLDQSSQQTVSGGTGPLFSTGLEVSADQDIHFGASTRFMSYRSGSNELKVGSSASNITIENTTNGAFTEMSETGTGGHVHLFTRAASNTLDMEDGAGTTLASTGWMTIDADGGVSSTSSWALQGAAPQLSLGYASTTLGRLALYCTGSANAVSIAAPANVTGAYTLTLPTAAPAGTYFLKVANTGAMSYDSSTYLTAEADTLQTVMTRGATTATQLTSTLATGTSPFAVTSTTVNANLNADRVDSLHVATTGSAVPNMASGNTWDGAQTFWSAAPQLTLGRASTTEGRIRLYDAQSANYADVGVSKLTTAAYTVEFPDHAAGTVNPVFGSGLGTYLAYWSSSTDLTGSKNLIVDGANAKLTLGAAGTSGQLALFSEQGATDRTATLKPNAAMTSDATFFLPADEPAGTYLMTMTSGGVMGFDSSTYLTTATAASTYVELAGDTMTGGLILPAGTTSVVPLRIPAGAAHSSQTEGNIWNDSTQKAIQTYVDGVKQTQTTCLFTATADADVAGGVEGTTETSLIGTGVGTLTLPANFLVAGKTIRVTVRGYVTTAATSNTCTFRAKLGSVAVITSAASAPTTGQSNRSWFATFDMTCRTTGATGTVYGQGSIVNLIGTSFTSIATTKMLEFSSTSAAVVDTTSSNAIDFTLQLGGTNADTWTSTDVTVEILN